MANVWTATTRTLTIPDASTTLVGIETAQTISNKIFDATNTFSSISLLNYSVYANNDVSTTSGSTYVALNSMTLTLPIGTYFVTFTGSEFAPNNTIIIIHHIMPSVIHRQLHL